MFVSSILLACLIARQTDPALERKVTFRCQAMTAAAAIDQLSKLSETPLSTQAPISGEMLVLRFKDVPLRIAMDRMATAASGEWVKTESGYTLTRPGTLIRAIEHTQRAERIAALKEALAKRLKDFQPYDANTVATLFDALRSNAKAKPAAGSPQSESRPAAFARQRPSERLTTRLLAGIDVENLADLPNGQRIVFSTRPTAMQRPLASQAYQAVQDFAREQQIWNGASNGLSVPGGRYLSMGQATASPQVIASQANRLLMVCVADWDYGTIQVQVKIADQAGQVLSDTRSAIFLRSFAAVADKPAGSPVSPGRTGKAIQLSPLAQELRDLLRTDENGAHAGVAKPISADLKGYLLNPVQNDPLDLFPSEPFLAAGDALDLNVAACVDDSDFEGSMSSDLTADGALSGSGKIKDGWFILSPDNPLKVKHEDRRALSVFLNSAAQKGRLTLEAKAAYAQVVDGFDGGLGAGLIDAIVPGLSGTLDGEDWLFLRLYGTLSATQRDMLLKGGRIPLNDLFSKQQAVVAQIVFGRDVESMESTVTATEQDGPLTPTSSLASEPTELLPNGLDHRVSITMGTSDETALFSSTKVNDQVLPMELTDTDSIAMSMIGPLLKDIMPEGFDEVLVGFRTGRKQTYSLAVNLPNHGADSDDLVDAQMQPGPVLTFDKLPGDTKKLIQDRIDEMTKIFKEMRSKGFPSQGQGQGTGVPPPR